MFGPACGKGLGQVCKGRLHGPVVGKYLRDKECDEPRQQAWRLCLDSVRFAGVAPKPPLMVTAQLVPVPAVTTMERPLLLLVMEGDSALRCFGEAGGAGSSPTPGLTLGAHTVQGQPGGPVLVLHRWEASLWGFGKYSLKQREWRAGASATPDQLLILARYPPLSASVYHRGSGPTGQAGA